MTEGGAGFAGRRGPVRAARSGRHVRSLPVTQASRSWTLDPSATLKAAVLRSGTERTLLEIQRSDLQRKVCRRPRQSLVVFLVDASESMATGAATRMKAARGAVLALLTGAYQRRDQVALIAFRGERAELLLAPTASVDLARKRLRQLPLGGATPFADGLRRARQLIEISRRRQSALLPILVIVSDGEANVPLTAGSDVAAELWEVAAPLKSMKVRTLIVDTSSVPGGSSILQRLALVTGGSCRRIHDLQAGQLYAMIRAAEEQNAPP